MNRPFRVTAEDIARELGHGKEVRQGDGWVTLCPAHNDSSPSFSVSDGKDGRLLVKCHAGCSQDEVIEALRARDLWPKAAKKETWKPLPHAPKGVPAPTDHTHWKHGAPDQWWYYYTTDGLLATIIYRFNLPDGKKFIQPRSYCVSETSGSFSWRWVGLPKPRPLYGLEKLKIAPKEATILLVEGEKTCDKAREIFPNLVVMTWAGGSDGVRAADWTPLKGRKVVIWPDADKPGHKAAASIAEILSDVDADFVSVVSLPADLPEGWDLADEIPSNVEMDPKLIVGSAKQYTPSGDLTVDELNRFLALTIIGDKPVIIWEKMHPTKGRIVPTYTSSNAMGALLANRTVPVGKKDVPVFQHWITHPGRRTYEGIVFEPGEDVGKHYNLWRGFTVAPEASGDWSMLHEHIYQNVAQGDESLALWILAWFAQTFQQPKEKPGTSLAMRGRQGVGKTILGQHMGHLIRDNYVYVDDSRYVLGNFNQHMAHALILQADEGFFAGDPRHTGRLKGLVTSETNRIEPKGKESFEIQNYMRLLVTSNSDWIVPTSFEERRFAIVDVGEGRMQDRAYFQAMKRQMEQGGYEGLLHYLLNMDLSTIDVGVIPKTNALMDQKEHSFDPVQKFWFERLTDGAPLTGGTMWDAHVECETFYQSFIARCQTWGIYRRPSMTQFIKELEAVSPAGSFSRVKRMVEVMTDGGFTQTRRALCNLMPDLDKARVTFEERVGYKIDWPIDGKVNSATPIDHERML